MYAKPSELFVIVGAIFNVVVFRDLRGHVSNIYGFEWPSGPNGAQGPHKR